MVLESCMMGCVLLASRRDVFGDLAMEFVGSGFGVVGMPLTIFGTLWLRGTFGLCLVMVHEDIWMKATTTKDSSAVFISVLCF